MVVSASLSKPSKLSTQESSNTLSFESLSILSRSSKPVVDDALFARDAQAPDEADTEDDTESFNEDECLFMEGVDTEEKEMDKGASHYYANTTLQSNSAPGLVRFSSIRPSSSCEWPNSARRHQNSKCYQEENVAPYDLHTDGPFDMRSRSDRDTGCDDQHSPFNIATASLNHKRTHKARKNSLSVRESLLVEAWERKRELMLHEELANFKEHAKPELLGRSSSDCGKLVIDVPAPSELRRSRTRSLTDDDFEELRGCIDLGFQFDQSSIPDLCSTLPALEVYCAVAQNLQESPKSPVLDSPVIPAPVTCSSPSMTPTWRISSPGDDPKDVKGRLRHWAQAVACNARLCY